MKKIVSIDNDNGERMEQDLFYVKHSIKSMLRSKECPELEMVGSFGHLSREDAARILFDPNNIIANWSVYSQSFVADSGRQLFKFLSSAGRNEIVDKIYLDCSSQIMRTLSLRLDDQKDVRAILMAIEKNYIITKTDDDRYFKRLRVNLQGGYYKNDFFTLEDVDFTKLFEL